MRATEATVGSDGNAYYIPSDAAELLGWSVGRIERTFELEEREAVVASVLEQLPPQRGPDPHQLVPAEEVEAVRESDSTAGGNRNSDFGSRLNMLEAQLGEIATQLDEVAERLGPSRNRPRYAGEPHPDEASIRSAYAAAVEAQDLAARRSANERRRLRAEQERLAAEEERLEIEERERELLLDQLRELALVEPPAE